ncbi:Kinesin-like protein klpA [Colletotrichum chlorophyti]|uniref:Kinesin-like protein klpA n=1 Tax=Colletotrichum chlorophyti TaxID=708187 RepID=A0A1Q8S5P6_9PEZI|nr:Kinesin-like protein klpA [Colletotrichum chlorophyti]
MSPPKAGIPAPPGAAKPTPLPIINHIRGGLFADLLHACSNFTTSSPTASRTGALLLVSRIIIPVVARRVDNILNMDTSENTHQFRSSVIRPPSNLPRPGTYSSSGAGLSEMSESQNNARAHPSMIPPPTTTSKIGGLSSLKREVPKPGWFFPGPWWERTWRQVLTFPLEAELSDPKHRKTLAERAAEYPTKSSTAATSGIARVGGPVRAKTLGELHTSRSQRHIESSEMAPKSNTKSNIFLGLGLLHIAIWIAAHLWHAARRMMCALIRNVPQLPTTQTLLVAFSLRDNDGFNDIEDQTRPRFQPQPSSGPTCLRSVSGKGQLWLGLQTDSGNSQSRLRVLLNTQTTQSYRIMDTDDRDELCCIRNTSNINPRHNPNVNAAPSTRYNSNGNFSASVGPARHERSKSSLAHSKSVHGQPRTRNTNAYARPRTAFSHRSEDEYNGPIEQQHGTALLSQQLNFPRPLDFQPNKTKHANPSPQMQSYREVSLSTRFSELSIEDDSSSSSAQDEDQVVFRRENSSISSRSTAASTGQMENVTICASRHSPLRPAPELLSPKKRQASRMTDPVTPLPNTKRIRAPLDRLGDTISSIVASRSPSPMKRNYLTKDSNLTQYVGWDVEGRLGELDSQFKQVKESVSTMLTDKELMDEKVEMYKKRISELETERDKLEGRNDNLQAELNSMREQMQKLTIESETERRSHKYELEDEARKHRHELDELRRELKDESQRTEKSHREALDALERHFKAELEDERNQKSREVQDLRLRLGNEQQDLNLTLQKKDREISEMRSELEVLKGVLDREHTLKRGLEASISELSASNVTLEAKINSLKSHVEFLESDSKAQSDSFANMEARLQEALKMAEVAKEKLIKEETERRILFNKYQELKGNIRVMCRVRPALNPAEGPVAKVAFPDEKTSAQIALQTEEANSFGDVSMKNYNFEFDRVFDPSAQNQDVFDEISQLVQSALDGYNVCIFCYGQTGSGKTHTMSSADGMIPRATHMIYDTVTKLKEKSWTYTMEGSFIEVYNEELNDLLTPNTRESDGKGRKLEIRHDDVRKQTNVLNCKKVTLDSADTVEVMLAAAQNNRSVAATKANERSSRSHSVFILKLVGFNSATGERCEGTLNLVDLAGSERLKHSQAEGARMKETQNINKSLSCLGDVIEALGKKSGHIPYRNSKLTHLLQYSLGGNSKTLMFVMVSPLEAHLKETVTSLRFATKVHNTHIGTAKATKKA